MDIIDFGNLSTERNNHYVFIRVSAVHCSIYSVWIFVEIGTTWPLISLVDNGQCCKLPKTKFSIIAHI